MPSSSSVTINHNLLVSFSLLLLYEEDFSMVSTNTLSDPISEIMLQNINPLLPKSDFYTL